MPNKARDKSNWISLVNHSKLRRANLFKHEVFVSMNLRSKYKISKISLVLFFALLIMAQQFCYAQGEPVIYSYKKTPITKEGVHLIGLFPIGQMGETGQIVTLGLQNDSPTSFKLKCIYADKIFVGEHKAVTNCPEELAPGDGCEYFFSGAMQPPDNIDSRTHISVLYYDGGLSETKEINIRPWAAILPLQNIFDFSESQTLSLENVFPDEIEVQRIMLLNGTFYGNSVAKSAEVPKVLARGNCNIIEPDGSCEVVIPAQKSPTQYRTLIVEYKAGSSQIQHCYIGLTNVDAVDSDNLKLSEQASDLGVMNYIYNNFNYYLIPAGVVVVTGGVWYYLHRIAVALERRADDQALALGFAALKAADRGGDSRQRPQTPGYGTPSSPVASEPPVSTPPPPPPPMPKEKQAAAVGQSQDGPRELLAKEMKEVSALKAAERSAKKWESPTKKKPT